ncbi:MAG: hypothetical protein AB7S38_15635 [Vulcanimicrobiota bacterium]
MVMALVLAMLFGWQVATRWLRTRQTVEAIAVGGGLAVVGLLVVANTGLRLGFGLGASLTVGLLLLGTAGMLCGRLEPGELEGLDSASWIGLFLGVMVVALSSNWGQFTHVDDDFWLHAPLQAHMLAGDFPPRNPYFPELTLRGHYGRDLLVVSVAYLARVTPWFSQMVVTTVTQVLSLLIYFVTFWRFTGSRSQAVLATGFIYLGVNAGYKFGLLEFYQNNTCPVYLVLGLLCYLILLAWQSERLGVAVACGLVLGVYPIVYETHFGLFILGLVGVNVCLLDRKLARLSLVALLVAMLFSLTQGGAFTNLAARALGAGPTQPMDQAIQNQSQSVSIHFPKRPFLHLKIAVGEGQQVSSAYRFRPPRIFFEWFDHQPERSDPNYLPLWSWVVLKIHWLALYLAPLTFLELMRTRHRTGLLFWWFGAFAFLVPGAFDFGPVHEAEYFRWQFAASFGLAAALGMALVTAAVRLAGDPELRLTSEEGRFQLEGRTRILGWLPVLLLVWLNTQPGRHFVGQLPERLRTEGGWLRVARLGLSERDWLVRHREALRFGPADFEASEWLRGKCEPNQRVLVNFNEGDPWAIHFESALAGRTGLWCVGHALPLDSDAIGLPPFRMQPEARALLTEPTLERCRQLDLDWIYLRVGVNADQVLETYGRVPGLEKAYHGNPGDDGVTRLIYRISP